MTTSVRNRVKDDLIIIHLYVSNCHYVEISLLFTNSISSDIFCWCKNKRHFFNVNICTCFNFREILCNRILEKRACQEPFFDTTMAIGNGVSFALHLIKVSYFQTAFMKSPFLPKDKQKISALCNQGRNFDNLWFVFWEKQ